MKKLKPKNGDALKKRSGPEVRGVSPEAGRESMVGKIVGDITSQAKIQSDRLSRNRATDKYRQRQTDRQHCYSTGLRLHSARFENTSCIARETVLVPPPGEFIYVSRHSVL